MYKRTKKKCGFRGFHTSCSGSQMSPSMETALVRAVMKLITCLASTATIQRLPQNEDRTISIHGIGFKKPRTR